MRFADVFDKAASWGPGVGAVLGLIGAEYLYFTNAEEVRLLFVILLAPVGAGVGALAAWIFMVGIVALAGISVVAAVVGTVIAVVFGVVYLLYSIIVWTN